MAKYRKSIYFIVGLTAASLGAAFGQWYIAAISRGSGIVFEFDKYIFFPVFNALGGG